MDIKGYLLVTLGISVCACVAITALAVLNEPWLALAAIVAFVAVVHKMAMSSRGHVGIGPAQDAWQLTAEVLKARRNRVAARRELPAPPRVRLSAPAARPQLPARREAPALQGRVLGRHELAQRPSRALPRPERRSLPPGRG